MLTDPGEAADVLGVPWFAKPAASFGAVWVGRMVGHADGVDHHGCPEGLAGRVLAGQFKEVVLPVGPVYASLGCGSVALFGEPA